jgi:serine phosphatase RsbU (regulator of sigma subunit)
MKTPSFEEIALLPEGEAVRKVLLANNYRVCLLLAVLSCGLALFFGVGWAVGLFASPAYVVAGAGFALLNLAFFALRHEPFFERHFASIAPLYAGVQLVLPGLFLSDWVSGLAPVFVLFGLVMLLLRPAEHLCLFGFEGLVLAVTSEQRGATFHGRIGQMAAVVAGFLALAFLLTWMVRSIWRKQWRRLHIRALEQERMRAELASARRIQLGMLPQRGPDLPWIELAAASVPAAEVGGDYYDYFRLGADRLVVVVADVAGHGLAPALLLSGLRSCLYLLDDELHSPVPVLERLTRMVRRTSGRRTFVTLTAAVLDVGEGRVRVTSAGHPPVLLWQAATGMRSLGLPAPPLGAFPGCSYAECESALGSGDVLAFYTDGLIEARNGRGDEYGEERLAARIQGSVHAASARQIRDAILSDLATFRGNALQEDDFSLVVARLR